MTALDLRQAVATVCSQFTVDGTQDNPVAATYFWIPDRELAFASTPALVVTSPDEEEKPLTLGVRTLGGGSTATRVSLQVDVEYLDSPLEGDDQQVAMAALEAWLEQAKTNLRTNRLGIITGNAPTWLGWTRLRTTINRPLHDAGRVLYFGYLSVWIDAIIETA